MAEACHLPPATCLEQTAPSLGGCIGAPAITERHGNRKKTCKMVDILPGYRPCSSALPSNTAIWSMTWC